jgi:hypothetical protein
MVKLYFYSRAGPTGTGTFPHEGFSLSFEGDDSVPLSTLNTISQD